MRAVVFHEGQVTTADVPDPEPGDGELLVTVESAGLNGADLLQLAGNYPPPPGVPAERPGMEIAGVVRALGRAATRFRIGDAVMGIVPGAGQAELAVIHERVAMPVPASLALDVAGGFPEVFVTAHDALVTRGALRSGERVLVTGAAGGVGTAAVQLAVAIGARVVAEVRAGERRASIAALGAEAVVGIEDAHRLGPYDVILELVGAPNLAGDLAALELDGRLVVIGLGGGAQTTIDLRQLLARRARVSGATMRNRPLEAKALVARLVEKQVLPLVDAGRLRVLVEATYPLEEAAAAYARFAAGAKVGKVLVHPRADPETASRT